MTIPGTAWGFVVSPALVSLSLSGPIPVAIGSVLPVVVSLAVVGVSISDWFGGDDEDDEPAEGAIDAAFEEAVGGGQGGGDPDDFGDFGDPTGDDGDWDGFGDVDDLDDGGGVDSSELEFRVDELESEVASVSSTMSTIRSENEEIGETVDEVEENVRKLLEVYEMVTQGVNPFVDEVQQGSADAGSFGLFDGGGERTDGEEDLEDDVANADVEAFFDDDFDEEFDADADGFDEDDGGFEFGHAGGSDDGADGGSGDGNGMTFEELKAEYEAGDADPPGAEPDDGPEHEDPTGGNADEAVTGPAPDAGEDVTVDAEDGAGTGEDAEPPADGAGNKPYLNSLPGGYGAELLVMEWLEYLLGNSNVAETLQAIRYYQNVEWISDEVADELRTVLGGFDRGHEVGAARTDGSGLSRLTIEHHETSLAYINRLTGDGFRQRSFEMGGGDRGI